MVLALVFLVVGIVLLWKCAEVLVKGAVRLSEQLGVSSFVVGLTVVAMGTSAPEAAASIAATLRGVGDVAIGNIYGSNIANLALVGGICSIIRPITVRRLTMYREIPVMVGAGLLLWPILHNLELSRIEGVLLLAIFASLLFLVVYSALRKSRAGSASAEGIDDNVVRMSRIDGLRTSVFFVIIGLAGVVLGADMVVRGAVVVGEHLGLSSAVIGLTIVAIGTSLPEFSTSLVAVIRGHHSISIGNLVGSNIFNTLLVSGLAGTILPFGIVERLAGTDYWIMMGVSVMFAFLVPAGRFAVARWCGIILGGVYAAYIYYLVFLG